MIVPMKARLAAMVTNGAYLWLLLGTYLWSLLSTYLWSLLGTYLWLLLGTYLWFARLRLSVRVNHACR